MTRSFFVATLLSGAMAVAFAQSSLPTQPPADPAPGRLGTSRPSGPSSGMAAGAVDAPGSSTAASATTVPVAPARPSGLTVGGTMIGGADGGSLWGGTSSMANTPGALMQPSWSQPSVPLPARRAEPAEEPGPATPPGARTRR
ncbi:MAG TPA: hypothetical protein VFE82_06550 [Ramlibacter sp.]|jgi:hypothetical protein|uniref:hypothetical protein n=1 Tax=Ramlibacter sp. TaxID=1917967 RepID=UPI002D74FD19|nr:hypothetical protein [Ramlibacter sp.]HZY18125.1 hypothetical protein [Ramlibacter sp.]